MAGIHELKLRTAKLEERLSLTIKEINENYVRLEEFLNKFAIGIHDMIHQKIVSEKFNLLPAHHLNSIVYDELKKLGKVSATTQKKTNANKKTKRKKR